MEMCLLDTLTMITLRVRQTEQAFLQEVTVLQLDSTRGAGPTAVKLSLDLLFAIPKCKGNVLYAVRIRYTGNSIFAPAESSRSCVIVGEVAPGITIWAVILSDYTIKDRSLACCFSIWSDMQALTCGPLSLRLYQFKELLAPPICIFPSYPRPRLTTYGPHRCFNQLTGIS